MDEIDAPNPALVRTLAATGLPVEDIAAMTRMDESEVRELLAPTEGEPNHELLIERPVNTTPENN